MSESRGRSTSAGNELMKREKGGNSPRGATGRVGAANGIVAVILPCVCAHVRAGRSRVCVEEYCRDQFTVVRVTCLSSEAFILGMFVFVRGGQT